MPVARINPNKPIIYGGSAITPLGSGTNDFYADPQRSLSLPNENSSEFFSVVDSRWLADKWPLGGGIMASGADTNGPTTSDAVVFYPAAGLTAHHSIAGIAWGYNGIPASGAYQIESPSGQIVMGPIPIVAGGPGFDNFGDHPLKGLANQSLLIRLKQAGGLVSGTISARGHRLE